MIGNTFRIGGIATEYLFYFVFTLVVLDYIHFLFLIVRFLYRRIFYMDPIMEFRIIINLLLRKSSQIMIKYTFVAGLFGLVSASTSANATTLTAGNKKIPAGILPSANAKLQLNTAQKGLGSNINQFKVINVDNRLKDNAITRETNSEVTNFSTQSSQNLGISSNSNLQSSYIRGNIFDTRSFPFDQQYDNRNYNPMRVINQASKNLMTPNRSLNSIFLRFPSCSQLDRLILSADAAAILKTIQTIATDTSVSCSQRLTYLSELLGRLKTAVQKKVYNANQLKVVIDSSIIQLQKLTKELQINRKYISNLGIQELKQRQTLAITQLQQAYGNLNNYDGQTPVLRAKIKGYQRQMELLSKNSQKQRGRIDNDKLKLIDLSNQVANLEAKLKQLSDRKTRISQNISKGQITVNNNQANISKLRSDVQSIELQLKNIRDISDRVNSQVRDLQVRVERIRTDASIDQVKRDRYIKQINELNDKIIVERRKLVADDFNKMNQMVGNLRNLLTTVQKTIDQRYFQCFGAGNGVKIQQSGDTVIYVVSGDNFGDYLRQHYGQTIKIPSIRSDVLLNKVDIFGSDWTGRFGYPFMEKSFDTPDFTINGSFNCLNEGQVLTGQGIISEIGPNFIQAVGDDGENRRFSLGSCSRLQSTFKVPKKGQKFYWSGVRGGQGYNLFGGSCIE